MGFLLGPNSGSENIVDIVTLCCAVPGRNAWTKRVQQLSQFLGSIKGRRNDLDVCLLFVCFGTWGGNSSMVLMLPHTITIINGVIIWWLSLFQIWSPVLIIAGNDPHVDQIKSTWWSLKPLRVLKMLYVVWPHRTFQYELRPGRWLLGWCFHWCFFIFTLTWRHYPKRYSMVVVRPPRSFNHQMGRIWILRWAGWTTWRLTRKTCSFAETVHLDTYIYDIALHCITLHTCICTYTHTHYIYIYIHYIGILYIHM